jgi:lysozyme
MQTRELLQLVVRKFIDYECRRSKILCKAEGFRGILYDDAANHCTIRYGHVVFHGTVDGTEPTEFQSGITEERGRQILSADVKNAEQALNNLVNVSLS